MTMLACPMFRRLEAQAWAAARRLRAALALQLVAAALVAKVVAVRVCLGVRAQAVQAAATVGPGFLGKVGPAFPVDQAGLVDQAGPAFPAAECPASQVDQAAPGSLTSQAAVARRVQLATAAPVAALSGSTTAL